jgi:ABC-2 type transport system ATP-binding protein
MTAPAVALDGVVKRFARGAAPALDGITASAQSGRITGVVGPDAAGKTTLLRLIAGLLAPEAGQVRLAAGADATLPGTLGYMPQAFGLYEDLTVADNLRLYADLQSLPPGQRGERAARLYGFTGLGAFKDRLAGKLSGGMKQKLGLACVLLRPPRVLLLDEPSVGVDPISRRELWTMVRELADDGMAVLWATAYLDEAGQCDRVWMLDRGRLIQDGTPDSFLDPVRGRCRAMPLPAQGRRASRAAALAAPGVLDAQIQGRTLRLLLTEDGEPPGAAAVGATGPADPVEPRFEDAFIARLGIDRAAAEAPEGHEDAPAPMDGDGDSPAILADGLTKRFGDFTAVDGVSFAVGRGEIFGLLGPNGAGKSTTFRMLCGLLPASGGTARVAGHDLAHARAEARGRIGYMSQTFAMYGDLSVRQNMAFFAGAYGLRGRAACRAIEAALDRYGLRRLAWTNAAALPLGYKQRLAMACAVLHRPAILFVDEPTSGVDPLTRRAFWGRINAMAARGVTVLVTSHFLDEAEYCDRLAIMHESRVIALGTPDAIKREHARDPDAPLDEAFVNLIAAQHIGAAAA